MQRNYEEDKRNIELIGRVGESISKLPFYVMQAKNRKLPPHYREYLFARYNPVDGCFYDYRWRKGTSLRLPNKDDLDKLEEGMLVEYSEFTRRHPDIVIPENCVINKELVKRGNLDYQALSEKYGEDLWRRNASLFTIIENYCEKRITEGKDVDPYIADVINTLGIEMGLKIATGGSLYQNGGYRYPEEIEQIVGGLYELLSLKFQGVEPFCDPHSICFNAGGFVPTDYIEFNNQLEYISGTCCGDPDLVNYIESEKYHQAPKERIEELKRRVPKFYFGKNESFFVEDSNNPDSYKRVIRRGESYNNWSFLKRVSPDSEENVTGRVR